ncbi:MAG: type II toxin-antitoxin system VapC family toxin [Gammaproteobacteria bacterium]|nr:type II toxin-antitoxin system VapC family toxin [Gammaproteobacteria bacterium]
MIGLDTNVVIRYLVQDDNKQSAAATRLVDKSLTTDTPAYINHITLCEIVWVLQRCYGVAKQQVRDIIEGLLTTKQLNVENVEVTWKALRAFDANNADFCDALNGQINIHSGCEYTVTFDKKAASLPGFDLLG